MNEPNKGLLKSFIQYIGQLAESAGPSIKKYDKILVPALLSNLSDKQSFVRADTLNSLDLFAKEIGIENTINHLPNLFTSESFELKKEILSYTLKNISYMPKADYKSFIIPLLNCLISKQKEIR